MEPALKYFGKHGLDRIRVIVHGKHMVNSRQLKHLCVQPRRKGLAIKLLAVFIITHKLRFTVVHAGPSILGAVVEIRLHQHHSGRTVFLGRTRNQQIAHRQILSTHYSTGCADNNNSLAL